MTRNPPNQPTEEDVEQAVARATRLVELLAKRNIPANEHRLPHGRVVVSVFAGLVAHVNQQVIWWNVPDLTGDRTRPLTTYAHTVESAADRLAHAYEVLRSVPIAELLDKGLITLVAAELLDGHDHAATPV